MPNKILDNVEMVGYNINRVVMKLSMLADVLSKEEHRIVNMITEYQEELKNLPKGSIRTKKNRERIYYYLSFREGKKVATKYIGKDVEAIAPIREKLERRKQIEEILKKLRVEREQIKKMEAVL